MARPRIYNDIGGPDITGPIFRPTPEMLAEAWRRNTAPRSTTAWVCGDPAPGQSALDKRSRKNDGGPRV